MVRSTGEMSYPDFADFQQKSRSFDGLVIYDVLGAGFAQDPQAQSQLKTGLLVSGNFFSVLGIQPRLGRTFRREEDEVPGRDAVVVLSHDLWRQEFAADPSVINRHVRLSDLDFTVIGVAPESFAGMDQFVRPSFFVPVMMGPLVSRTENLLTDRSKRSFLVKGRLKPGISIQSAAAEASVFARSLAQSYPETNRALEMTVRSEIQARLDVMPFYGPLVVSLFILVMVVLLIGCANVANLMLGRGRSRAREIAVRLAIGASRTRLVRQLMVENLLVAVAGGGLGLLIAEAAVEAFSTLEIAGDVPIKLGFQLDERVLLFTLFVSIASAILFGLGPSLQSTKTDLSSALKAGELDQARKRFFGRNFLVTVQVAGSQVLLLASAGIYLDSARTMTANPGFRKDHVLLMRFDTDVAGYSASQAEQFFRTLVDRSREVPGIKSAGLSFFIPMMYNVRPKAVIPEGYQFQSGQDTVTVLDSTVDEHYFEAFGVPIVQGRAFRATDRADSPSVAIVNETFAKRYLGQSPVGKRIRLNDQKGPWIEIVGVAIAGKYLAMAEPPAGFLYLPLSQNPEPRMTLIASTAGDPGALAAPMRDMVHSIDPNMPIFGVRTMEDLFEQSSVKSLHLTLGMFAAVSLMGLVLALVGLYAVVAYQVSRRTREIGIRMALGAERPSVIKMILKQAAATAVTGVCIGLVLSLAFGRALVMGRPETVAFNPALFALVPLGLLLTALLAAAIPALRASRIDPQQALRQD